MLSRKDLYGNKGAFKYFIGYISNAGIIPLCIRLPQMNVYAKYFDNGSKCMNLLVRDEVLIKEYNEIWDKIRNLLKKEFDSESVYNDKYMKTKTNLYNTYGMNFYVNKMPKENERYTCLSVKLLDSIFVNLDKKCYIQIFLEECKHPIKKKVNE